MANRSHDTDYKNRFPEYAAIQAILLEFVLTGLIDPEKSKVLDQDVAANTCFCEIEKLTPLTEGHKPQMLAIATYIKDWLISELPDYADQVQEVWDQADNVRHSERKAPQDWIR